MPQGSRDIRRKIKSIKSTRQITKAMELVAASKMRKAVANTLALRPYAHTARLLIASVSEKADMHALLAKREVKKALVVAVGSDRGLCGSLNAQLFRKITEYVNAEKQKQNPPDIKFIAVGKKIQDFLRRSGQLVLAAYPSMSSKPCLKDTFSISRFILQEYSAGLCDKVVLIYTDFISAISQKPTTRRLLPLSRYALEEMIEGLESKSQTPSEEGKVILEYIFEPSPSEVLSTLLPRLTEMQIYQAILEAAASEHSARMFAMRNATDNATEFIEDLTLMYNQMRQASITKELAEISAGRAALG